MVPSRPTLPFTDVLSGSVICARSPVVTWPCCDGSRDTCTSSVSEVAFATGVPGGAVPPSSPLTAAMRADSGRNTAWARSSDPVRPSPSLDCSFSSADAKQFGAYMARLTLDMLRLPALAKSPSTPTAPQQTVLTATANGYVPLTYEPREGEQTAAWYRGPLAAAAVAPALSITAM